MLQERWHREQGRRGTPTPARGGRSPPLRAAGLPPRFSAVSRSTPAALPIRTWAGFISTPQAGILMLSTSPNLLRPACYWPARALQRGAEEIADSSTFYWTSPRDRKTLPEPSGENNRHD